jgi:hypothetical protein
MGSSLDDFLKEVEGRAATSDLAQYYLWPRTPIGDEIQDRIRQRVGAGDLDRSNPSSRPAVILRFLKDRIAAGALPANASILDIACGDAAVLLRLQQEAPALQTFGVDCNKGKFPLHLEAERAGVGLRAGYIQHLFAANAPVPFDVVLMLNTYRGWESADLRPHEEDLPRLADAWFTRNGRITIVTATRRQIRRLKKEGWTLGHLGKGEDDSLMVALSRDAALIDPKTWPAPGSWF